MSRFRPSLIPVLAAIVALVFAHEAGADDPAKVTFTILQVNDVYEIRPLDHGATGGLARVAGLRKALTAEEPNTFTLLAGDTLGPSPMGNARIDGIPVAGRQMVECWNALGLDYAAFGNHEFDLGRAQFLARLRESDFTWVASNVTDRAGVPFSGVPGELVLDVRNKRGDSIRVGLFGLTIQSNPVPYVRISPALDAARARAKALRERSDVVIAITHLDLAEDMQIAAAVPEISLIIGGHEHVRHYEPPGVAADGRPTPPIAKADANARSAWVHKFSFDPTTRQLDLDSSLRVLDDSITPDRTGGGSSSASPSSIGPDRWWVKYSFAFFQETQMFPGDIVAMLPEPGLDGRESQVRYGPTNLTQLVGQAMLLYLDAVTKDAEAYVNMPRLAIFNSGTIRIDDAVPAGPLVAYDLHRTLPYPTTLRGATMTGAVVADLLARNPGHVGNGPFLQAYDAASVTLLDGQGQLDPTRLDSKKTYLVCVNDFLIDGREQDFGDLKTTKSLKAGLTKPDALNDLGSLRDAVFTQLQKISKPVPTSPSKLSAAVPFANPGRVRFQLAPAAR